MPGVSDLKYCPAGTTRIQYVDGSVNGPQRGDESGTANPAIFSRGRRSIH